MEIINTTEIKEEYLTIGLQMACNKIMIEMVKNNKITLSGNTLEYLEKVQSAIYEHLKSDGITVDEFELPDHIDKFVKE